MQRIAGWGFDHVRLPIDEEQMWDDAGGREVEAFDLLGQGLDWCAAAGLRVVVDLHILRSHHFNQADEPRLYTDPAEQARYCDLWRDPSAFLRDRPNDHVAYELLNEPVARDPADWNRVAHAALAAVRATEAERTVVLGSNWFQTCDNFPALDVPGRDAEPGDHLILSCHFYSPMFITHYRAPWWRKGADYDGLVQYPGRPIPDDAWANLSDAQRADYAGENGVWNRDAIASVIGIAAARARETDRPLYCSEFGCRNITPRPARDAWYRDVVSVFAELGIAFANWDYRGGFGLIDEEGNDTGIAKLLLGD